MPSDDLRVYKFKANKRKAEIIFKKKDGKFEFEKCNYSIRGIYTLDDWIFLSSLSQKIFYLVKENSGDLELGT